MSQQTIDIGTAANNGTGDPLRTGGAKINANFDELYAAAGNPNLLALSGLIGAADRLPYFTGVGALSLSTLTAYSRQLLALTSSSEWKGVGGLALVKADVGLSGVDNTPDVDKPVSTATQTALDGKQASSPNLTSLAAIDSTAYGRDLLTLIGEVEAQGAIGLPADVVGKALLAAETQDEAQTAIGMTEFGKSLIVGGGPVLPISLGGTGASTPERTEYIEGLIPVWNSITSISVGSGSAYIPGAGKLVKVDSTLTLTDIPLLTPDVFYYIYLYDNGGSPAIELSSDAPVTYRGYARTKPGDDSRRYIAAVRTGTGQRIINFQWGSDGFIRYLTHCVQAPFRIIAGATNTTKTNVSCVAVVPPTSRVALASLINAVGSAVVQMSHPDVGPTDVLFGVQPNARNVTPIALAANQQFSFYNSAAGGGFYVDIIGYSNER